MFFRRQVYLVSIRKCYISGWTLSNASINRFYYEVLLSLHHSNLQLSFQETKSPLGKTKTGPLASGFLLFPHGGLEISLWIQMRFTVKGYYDLFQVSGEFEGDCVIFTHRR